MNEITCSECGQPIDVSGKAYVHRVFGCSYNSEQTNVEYALCRFDTAAQMHGYSDYYDPDYTASYQSAKAALLAEIRKLMDKAEEAAAVQQRIAELEAQLAAEREAARWIPVGERLPESETVVIVYDRRTDKVYEGYLSSEAGGWCENTWWLRRLHNVTYWMPKVLPEPPEGGEG